MKSIAIILLLAFASSTFKIKLTGSVNFYVDIDMEGLVPVKPEGPVQPVSTEELPCDPESCTKCEKNGDALFCTKCLGKSIVGTGNNRRCQGEAPEGCLEVRSLEDYPILECSRCDEENQYYSSVRNGINVCVKCDLSSNILELGTCTPAPRVIDNCKKHMGLQCEKCQEGFDVTPDWVSCLPLPKNCESIDSHGDCKRCELGYYFENSQSTPCNPIPVKNCLKIRNSRDKCYQCASGFFEDYDSCSPLPFKNCSAGNESYCYQCKPGFFRLKKSGDCVPVPSCSMGRFGDDEETFFCGQCNWEEGYFAVGARNNVDSIMTPWQVCKKKEE